jgi:twitching motility protein PilJ
MALKIPGWGGKSGKRDNTGGKPADAAPAAEDFAATVIVNPASHAARKKAAGADRPAALPLIGRLPVLHQYLVLGAALLVMIFVAVVTIVVDNRQASYSAIYLSTGANMRMLTQRIAKATQDAITGNAAAFRILQESRQQFISQLSLLSVGGELGGARVPAASDSVQPVLDTLKSGWDLTDRNLGLVLAQQKNLAGVGAVVRSINSNSPALLELAEQVQAAKVASNAPAREVSATARMVTLTQRLAKTANALLGGDAIDAQMAAQMDRDAAAFAELLTALQAAGDGPRRAGDTQAREKLAELQQAYGEFQAAMSSIVGNLKPLVEAKTAARRVVDDSESLLGTSQKVVEAFEREISGRAANFVVLAIVLLLSAGVIWAMVRVYVNDERLRSEEVERQRAESERQNQANQDAILRLMNEMSTIADGDLRARATVTEDITGAIADSVNFTVEELAKLVSRINETAEQVAGAAAGAQITSNQLLAAADYQSKEIQQTSASVLETARAMNKMTVNATQSADVASQSLAAAGKGSKAVHNAIAGMNEIRDQIQETSKRIKRLGESSQEIGEIVDLIADITEQTNVLAMNAAIQAASAGEAGRGFSVVAEEVQRLAERSAGATKQINAIVKTIQTDTHDAVGAMERSTQGVVEGARLSDAAGQALAEIDAVSRKLATLIAEISATTDAQAKAATKVANSMGDILRITEQASEGTKRTAGSIGKLSELARALKESVSNFKIG